MGASLTRVKATMGAPERSGPYSGNAWKYLPWPRANSATILAAVTAPWPPRPCQRISVRPAAGFCLAPVFVAMVTPRRAAGCDALLGRGDGGQDGRRAGARPEQVLPGV